MMRQVRIPTGVKTILKTEFEVLIVVAMINSVFWYITRCSIWKIWRRFGGTYPLGFQGWRISHATNQGGARGSPTDFWVPYPLYLKIQASCCSETSVYFQRTMLCVTTELFIGTDSFVILLSPRWIPEKSDFEWGLQNCLHTLRNSRNANIPVQRSTRNNCWICCRRSIHRFIHPSILWQSPRCARQ